MKEKPQQVHRTRDLVLPEYQWFEKHSVGLNSHLNITLAEEEVRTKKMLMDWYDQRSICCNKQY